PTGGVASLANRWALITAVFPNNPGSLTQYQLYIDGVQQTLTQRSGTTLTTRSLTNVVTAATITSGGSGYTSAPTVTFSGGGATTQAVGIATIVNGVVSSIT